MVMKMMVDERFDELCQWCCQATIRQLTVDQQQQLLHFHLLLLLLFLLWEQQKVDAR